MHRIHIGRGHIHTRWGWCHSRHHRLRGESERWGCDLHPLSNTVPGRGSIEGGRERSYEIAPVAEPGPSRTRVVAPVEGREECGVVNAVVRWGAGQPNCENSVSRNMATWSLGSRVNAVIYWSLNPAVGRTDGGGFNNLSALEGVELALYVHNGWLRDRDSKEWIWLRMLGEF